MAAPRRVLLVSIDGLRPDGLQQAQTPHLDRLIARGAVHWTVRSVMPSATLPCHTSMFRSVLPERHGITTNRFTPLVRPVPSVTDVVHRAGRPTAAFYNWEELRDLSDPGSLNAAFFWRNCYVPEGDHVVADWAARFLTEHEVHFAFLYLGHVDVAGHNFGWMSPEYLQAVHNADAALGTVLEALEEIDLLEETAVLVLSDHGGHERTHGTDAPEDMTVPLVAAGPGVRTGGVELKEPASLLNVAPTVTALLGIAPAQEWDGQPLTEMLA
ncbi:MAG: hypothetical protein KatS3mg115_1637 [Candidatus Poribacteria bacterium]|nr:MAG: hypothetical protein KatS3mg115_1637 [Candidatus Poribacteria bacterium]